MIRTEISLFVRFFLTLSLPLAALLCQRFADKLQLQLEVGIIDIIVNQQNERKVCCVHSFQSISSSNFPRFTLVIFFQEEKQTIMQ